jgi:uncharacterized protein
MQLGQLLPKLPREKIIVQTKVGPTEDPKKFLEKFEKSMNYLKLDHIDLFGIHGINNEELLEFTLRKGGCLEAARQLQKDGRVRFIGFSTHAVTRVITQAIETGEFDYVNLHWYFVNHLNWPSIEAATARDMGVFIISPNDKGGKLYDPPKKLSELCKPLTPMGFNDLFCLSRKEVHTLSCGAAKPSDFDEHIEALKFYDTLNETIAPVEQKLRNEMERVLGKEWCARWAEAIPEFVEIPNRVNVLEILRLWTYAKSLDLVEWGKMRYNLLSGAGEHWFPGEMANHMDEKLLITALEKNPFASKIPSILKEAHEMLFAEPKKRLSQS